MWPKWAKTSQDQFFSGFLFHIFNLHELRHPFFAKAYKKIDLKKLTLPNCTRFRRDQIVMSPVILHNGEDGDDWET